MKAFIITIALCLFSFLSSAKNSPVVSVMKKVIDIEIDKHYNFFYLQSISCKLDFNQSSITQISKSCNNQIPIKVLKEFLYIVQSDTMPINWRKVHLPRAKFIDAKHLPKPASFPKLMKGMPLVDSLGQVTKNSELMDYREWEKAGRYAFSKPVFSTDKEYVLVTTNQGESGGCYILKNDNGKWDIVFQSRWMA